MKNKRVLGIILVSTTLLSSFATSASAVNVATAINEPIMVSSTKTVNTNAILTGDMIHRATSFLYCVSS